MWAESTDVIGDFGLLSSDPIQRSIPGPGQMPLLSPDISATILDPPLSGVVQPIRRRRVMQDTNRRASHGFRKES